MTVYVRYDTPWKEFDVDGERKMLTRRQGYPEHTPAPPLDIPEAGEHLWDWYSQISQRLPRVRDGVCEPIPPTEWVAWLALTGEIVHEWEHGVLAAMDVAFCAEMNKELQDKRTAYQNEVSKRGKGKR